MVFEQNCLATYKGENNPMGFTKGHIYAVIVEQKEHGCELSVYHDTTINHDFVKEKIPYTNEKSIQHFWEF
uniref:hypothetical protein n=1 Tax=Clostridium sp. 12(A) TaxID=1163671 RepID=UPI00046601B2|nr:hypothetical protein [Clostridium sp. 12(A)]